jgi:hypothetical protein
MTTTAPNRMQRREAARAALAAQRAPRLPLTFLGTGGDDKPADEQGWQPHMWTHQLFMSGAVFAAGQAVHAAVEKGILETPLPFAGGGLFAALCASGLGLAGAAAGLIATAGEKFTDWTRAYFAGGPLAAGAYLAAVANTSPYSAGSLTALAAGTAIGMGMYRRMRMEQDEHELAYVARWTYPSTAAKAAAPAAPAPAVYEELDPEKRKWNDAFARVGLKGCKALKRVDTPAGYAMLVGLPASGNVQGAAVAAKLPNLEIALRMLKDCLEYDVAVNREGRELSDRCWIHVDVANILEQLLEMPDGIEDHEPRSINTAIRVGTFMDGSPMWLRFREISALIVGVRGRGKTNLFHVLVHRLSQCIDVVLWAIDLKGGRAVKPWLKPWLDDQNTEADRPVFDWVATTRAEASLMIHAAQFLIEFRGKKSSGGSKVTPTVDTPAVIVMCDEIAALVGKHSGPRVPVRGKDWWRNPTATQISGVLTLCIQLGRSEAVDFILFTQRATVSMVGGGDLKSQCEMRIGLGVTNKGDASSVFQNDTVNARKLSKLKHKKTRGACLIENGDNPNHLCGKTYFYGDDAEMVHRIYRTATLHASYPSELSLDEQQAIDDALFALTDGEMGYGVGSDAAGDQRWSLDRAAHLYTDDLAPEWDDDDPSDGTHLGGHADSPVSGAGARSATATLARPRSAPPAAPRRPAEPSGPAAGPRPPTYNRGAAIPTSPGHAPLNPTSGPPPAAGGNRYYTPRTERAGDQGTAPAAGAGTPPAGGPAPTGNRYYRPRAERQPGQPATEPEGAPPPEDERRYQDEFDKLVRFLDSAPDADEPEYDTSDPEQLSRYEVVLDIIKKAGTAGIMPGGIMAEMVKRGRAWSRRTELHPALRRAKDQDHLVVQPRERGRYYWHEYGPGPTA